VSTPKLYPLDEHPDAIQQREECQTRIEANKALAATHARYALQDEENREMAAKARAEALAHNARIVEHCTRVEALYERIAVALEVCASYADNMNERLR
jgi:hypothetical protein